MPSRSERKLWRSLRRRKGRDAAGLFLAEGPRLLEELLGAGHAIEAVLHTPDAGDDPAVRDLLQRARDAAVRVEPVERRTLEEIADAGTPQAVLAIAPIPAWSWEDVPPGPLVLLDGVQDPGNAGGLTRTAAALGAAGVVSLEGSADPWGPKAVRASAGAALRRPVFRADRASTVAELARRRVPIWVADVSGEPLSRGAGRVDRVAIALGSETHGVSPEVAAAAERSIAIAMHGGVESLNVAAAGAILLDRLIGPGD